MAVSRGARPSMAGPLAGWPGPPTAPPPFSHPPAVGASSNPWGSLPPAGPPRGSPDGRQIAFDGGPEGHLAIYGPLSEGGQPRRLTAEGSDDKVPSWSRDGRWIYFASNRSGTNQVWKMPAEGGQAVQVTR